MDMYTNSHRKRRKKEVGYHRHERIKSSTTRNGSTEDKIEIKEKELVGGERSIEPDESQKLRKEKGCRLQSDKCSEDLRSQ